MIDVKVIVLLSFLVVACGGQPFEPELFGAGGAAAGAGGAGTGGSAGAAGAGGIAGAEDSGVDAVVDGEKSDGGDAAETDAPCTTVQHFNGYNTFGDCHEVGYYDEALALKACAVYMNVSCEVLTSLNLCGGINLVGHKSEAWIVWTWTATTGTTRLSWSTPPECPTASDPAWW